MKHWKPTAAAAAVTPDEAMPEAAEGQSRDAWIAWLNHAPLHGVTPDLHKPKAGWAGFGVIGAVGVFWLGIAWMLFGG